METRQLPVRENKVTKEEIPVQNSVQETECEVSSNSVVAVFEKSGAELIAFVEKHIKKMEESLLFDGSVQPTFFELNRSLCSYEGVLLSLIAMYEEQRFQAKQAKEVYEIWFAEKFIGVRDRENQRDLAAAKWLSAGEIERKLIAENRDEYSRLRSNVILAESKESSLRRLIDGWNSYQFILSNLCKNSQVELSASMRSLDAEEGVLSPNSTY